LAEMTARLIRETNCDGIRLDSCGSKFAPCYNKNHCHSSPYDYNKWLFELIEKVAKAARAVKPDIILSTEFPLDYFSIHFNEALHRYKVHEGPAPLTVAFPNYRISDITDNLISRLKMLLRKGPTCYLPWIEKHYSVKKIFQRGKVQEDAKSTLNGSQCRRLSLNGEDLLIYIRSDADNFIKSSLEDAANYNLLETTIECPLDYVPAEVYELDIFRSITNKLEFNYKNGIFSANISSPLSLIYIRRDIGGILLNIEAEEHSDDEYEFSITSPSESDTDIRKATITVKELYSYEGYDSIECIVPGKIKIKLPSTCQAGKYRFLFHGDTITPAMKIIDKKISAQFLD